VNSGIDLTVISCIDKEKNREWGSVGGKQYNHIVLPGLQLQVGAGRFAHINLGIKSALEAAMPEVLVINGFYPSMLVAAGWASQNKVPLALTIDGWAETMPNSIYHRIIRPRVLRMCSKIFVCSEKGRDYFLSQGFTPADIFLVPLTPAWPAPESSPPLEERPYHLLWVAHINNEVKNAAYFVQVARQLSKSIPDLRLRVVGNGPNRPEFISSLDEAGLDYDYSSAVNWAQMPSVFLSSRILVLPSLWEPWALVCNEAMQCGVPCIVSHHVGAADDLVRNGRNGIVAPLVVEQWVEEISKIILKPATWHSFSEAAREDVSARTLTASCEQLVHGLRSTLTAWART
jgi:glycosyltransferase involved in cell wall biosynthesis